MIPRPLALALSLCDQVIVEEGTRKLSLVGGFNGLRARSFPFVPSPFCVIATLSGGLGEAEVTLAVTELQSDEEIYSLTRQVRFPDRFVEVHVLFRLAECSFPAAGG